ncbi:MAG TPA: LytTR family DNA-binding domain-containing protein [Solirubrobacteraceae bacterium]|nr:LytTR family DNA-binding domain-containing protein [Solirubrobacteraceae bacterium]
MTHVLVVDDERPALQDLGRLLETSPSVEDVVLAEGGAEALRALAERRFDVVFMDVRMPDIDGLELGKALTRFAEPPALVFVSAFEDGAVSAFEHDLHPLDYLMKPVSRARVEQALGRAAGDWSRPPHSPINAGQAGAEDASGQIIPVEHQRGGATRLLDRSTVLYVQAEGDYVRLHTDSGRFLIRAALSEIEQRWGKHGFVRVHRSYVANLKRAVEIRPKLGGAVTIVMADGSEVPVARRQVADLRRRLRM